MRTGTSFHSGLHRVLSYFGERVTYITAIPHTKVSIIITLLSKYSTNKMRTSQKYNESIFYKNISVLYNLLITVGDICLKFTTSCKVVVLLRHWGIWNHWNALTQQLEELLYNELEVVLLKFQPFPCNRSELLKFRKENTKRLC